MMMLKKFWNYQLVLSASIYFGNDKGHSKIPPLSYILFIIFMITFTAMLDGGGIVFFPIIGILYMTYGIINSQHKLYELVPVSKLYSHLNIYLYILVTSFYTIVIFALMGLLLFLSQILLTFIFDLDPVISMMSSSLNDWILTLIPGCISIILVSILLPIFFIRHNFLRKALTLSVVALTTIVLKTFRNTLPIVPELGEISFLESIIIMPHYSQILFILACVCVVILPISMLISYRLYKGKRCIVC